MLNAVLREINNYFFEYSLGVKEFSYSKDVTFTSSDTLGATDFSDTFIVGEYILVEGSRVNDGVYLISSIDATTITVDATVDLTITTEPERTVTLTKLFIPKELIALIAEIKTYDASVTTGLSSETQGNRSVSYADGGSSWKKAFGTDLSVYKRLRWC